MRDYLLLYINGRQHRVSGDQAFMPLSTYLRYEQGATGTKVVCEEGDCGACSIILGRLDNGEISYKPVNSCIQFLYQLDCSHIITIEGLKNDGELNPVQEAMVACHGAQCGYCTPGFVVAMCAMLDGKEKVCEQDVRDGLTGNLCRCTGYEPIINAGLSVDTRQIVKLHNLYPSNEMRQAFAEHCKIPVSISTPEHTFFNPVTVEQAAKFRADNPGTVIVAGGTDVCVFWNKRGIEPKSLLSVSNLPDLDTLKVDGETLIVGAKTTLSQLEDFCSERLPELKRLLWLFGSPQIRNAGTLAGNIANGSPIGDSLPFLFVMEAEIELAGVKGTRRVNINQFYKGYKQVDIKADEIITHIRIPLPKASERVRLYKVSRRRHLDICAFSAAFRMTKKGQTIDSISIAYGGVAATVVRLPKTEAFLRGKEITPGLFEEAGAVARSEITPISDVRGSSDFRYALAENILQKFYYEMQGEGVVACQQ